MITVALAVEMAVIYGQAAVGHRSHYNVDTPLDAALWNTMAVSIVALWLATLAVALRFVREPGLDRATAAAVRLGLAVALVGLAEGFLMASAGAHAVGVPDGGPGLPFLGWSTVGGDLRIAHFVGMHALQGLPLLAAALAPLRLTDPTRVRLVRIAAAAWAGMVVLLTWQALRAQPLLAPDTATLAALGGLAAATLVALAAVLVRARRGPALVLA